MIDEKYKQANVSEIFLKPLLTIRHEKLKDLNYLNTYLFNGMEESDYGYDVIYLLFDVDDLKLDLFLQEEEDKGSIILEKYCYGNFRLISFLLPVHFKEDYQKIIEGKYSKVSHEFKKLFPKFAVGKTSISLQYMVFNKDKYLKEYWEKEFNTVFTPEMEYWKLYDINKETFKYEK